MTESEDLVRSLLSSQLLDGGWSYALIPDGQGTNGAALSVAAGTHPQSRVEPTSLCLMALSTVQDPLVTQARNRAMSWLLVAQRKSGGWSPAANVDECTSVTSLALIALLFRPQDKLAHLRPDLKKQIQSAVDWTQSQVYTAELSLSLLLSKLLGLPPAHAPGSVAWFPGTAGWVTPTSLAALALLKSARVLNRPELANCAHDSCQYLLGRRCVDHGWNHGGSATRSEDAKSYPETTGLALLALRAASINPPAPTIALAKRFASTAASMEGLAWIQLAFSTDSSLVPDKRPLPHSRTTRDMALRLLAITSQKGQNMFIEEG